MASVEAEPITTLADFEAAMNNFRTPDPAIIEANPVIFTQIDASIQSYVNAAFPDDRSQSVYVQKYSRDIGFGPHFDVYSDFLDPEEQYVVLLYTRGTAAFRATRLPDDLSKAYYANFPEPYQAAHKARRSYASEALGRSDANIIEGTIRPGNGLVFPQSPLAGDVAHEITPTSSDGEFLKFAIPNFSNDFALEVFEEQGYMPFSSLIDKALIELSATAGPNGKLPVSDD